MSNKSSSPALRFTHELDKSREHYDKTFIWERKYFMSTQVKRCSGWIINPEQGRDEQKDRENISGAKKYSKQNGGLITILNGNYREKPVGNGLGEGHMGRIVNGGS